MEKIAPNVYIETGRPGVTTGVFTLPRGLVHVDAPLLAEDVRAWRASLMGMNAGAERILILLDAHPDRVLNARLMECPVIAHERAAQMMRSRIPITRLTNEESGAEWEAYTSWSTTRLLPPELSFSENLLLHWAEEPLRLESRPGASNGAIWVRWDKERVLFIGDAVCKKQPPFLAQANIPEWLANLRELTHAEYADFLIVSGRGGLVSLLAIREQIAFLEAVQERLQDVPADAADELFERLAQELLKQFKFPQEPRYFHRLRYGLKYYHTRRQPLIVPIEEE